MNCQRNYASKKYSSLKSKLKKKGLELEKLWSRDRFISWYSEQDSFCFYCKCELKELRRFNQLNPSKYEKRGNSLEIERIDSKKNYIEENCTLCCFYCNNSKSDIFTQKQFNNIASAIYQVVINEVYNNEEFYSQIKENYPSLSVEQIKDVAEVAKKERDFNIIEIHNSEHLEKAINLFFSDNEDKRDELLESITSDIVDEILLVEH